jgi:hypothetical protein
MVSIHNTPARRHEYFSNSFGNSKFASLSASAVNNFLTFPSRAVDNTRSTFFAHDNNRKWTALRLELAVCEEASEHNPLPTLSCEYTLG